MAVGNALMEMWKEMKERIEKEIQLLPWQIPILKYQTLRAESHSVQRLIMALNVQSAVLNLYKRAGASYVNLVVGADVDKENYLWK